MPERYFRRVARLTPTKFWINNPTRDEARWAIAGGGGGKRGSVTIQSAPIRDEDTALIIEQSVRNRLIGSNIACKIPTTEAGLAAMEALIPLDTPLNATEIFAVKQMTVLCDTYSGLPGG